MFLGEFSEKIENFLFPFSKFASVNFCLFELCNRLSLKLRMPKFSELSYLSTSVVNPHGFALTSVDWIRIRNNIGNADLDPGGQNDLQKGEKSEGISCFEVPDVLF